MLSGALPLLELHRITKSFAGVRALKGVDFTLLPGEVHALLGENGAGKSTLIKVIAGAHHPDSGQIVLDGKTVERLTPAFAHALGIACIYQQPALFPELTVSENIMLRLEPPRAFRWLDWKSRRQRTAEYLGRIGASISPDADVKDLSMPEQQLVEIACAIGAGARIVIMDEPTASLTAREQELLFQIARDLRRQGVGVIYISHRMDEIFALADRVTVLRDGESVGTVAAGAVDEAGLIRMMVGREVDRTPPAAPACRASDLLTPKIRLALSGVGCAAAGVRDISLEVRAGEIFGLAGLVGAGRTELARILFGITPADAGTIRLDGAALLPQSPSEAAAAGIAYLPEDRRRHGVILDLPIAHNATLAIHRTLFPRRWLDQAAERSVTEKFIRRLDVRTTGPDAFARELSGGNQQKVALARWLATEPKVLILDEPTQGVDVGAKQEIHRIIRQLAAEGMAVVLISSDLPEIIGMSDRIGVMRGGRLVDILPGGAEPGSVLAAALGQAREGAA